MDPTTLSGELVQTTMSVSSGGGTGMLIIWLVVYLFYSYCLYLIAKKLGEQYAWMAWVPVLNIVLQMRMASMSLWWILGLFIPLLNIYVLVILIHRSISLRTGHGGWWTVGLIFLGWIFYPITAFGYKPGQATQVPVTPPTQVI